MQVRGDEAAGERSGWQAASNPPQAELRQAELHESSAGFLSVSLTFQSLAPSLSLSPTLPSATSHPIICRAVFLCSLATISASAFFPLTHVNLFHTSSIIPPLSFSNHRPSLLCHPFTSSVIHSLSFPMVLSFQELHRVFVSLLCDRLILTLADFDGGEAWR